MLQSWHKHSEDSSEFLLLVKMNDDGWIMIGTEVKTSFGWGTINEINDGNKIQIVLEQFEGWGSSKPPILYTYSTDPIIMHHSRCAVGCRVFTRYGSGVVIDYQRQRDVYVVCLWATCTVAGLGSGMSYMLSKDIIKCYASNEIPDARFAMLDSNGKVLSSQNACALPTIDILFKSLPNNAGLQDSAMDLITQTMLTLNRIDVRADGEGLVLSGEDGKPVLDSSTFVCASKIKDFIKNANEMLASGEDAVMRYIATEGLQPSQVMRLYDHWKSVTNAIRGIMMDFKMFEIHHNALNSVDNILPVVIEPNNVAEDTSGSQAEPNYYEILCRLRGHVSRIRELFDVADEEISGLEMISDMINTFRKDAMKPFEELPGIISDKLKNILPDTTFIASKISSVTRSDRGLTRRVGAILASMSPGMRVFSSAPSLSTFQDIENFLGILCDFFLNSKLPGIVLKRLTSSNPLKSIEIPDVKPAAEILMASISNLSVDSLKSVLHKQGEELVGKVALIDLSDFREMLCRLIESIAKRNPKLSGYALRRALLDVPHVGLVLMICHLYQADDLSDVPLVKSLTDNIPGPLKLFLAKCLASDVNLSAPKHYRTLDEFVKALEAIDGIAERILTDTTHLVSRVETAQSSDTYQMAMAHLNTMDINLLENAKDVVLASKILPNTNSGAEPDLLSAAELALTDESARSRLIDTVKDSVLDFLVSYIPTINISSLDGQYENVEYSISGMDLSGFRFKKESVHVNFENNMSNKSDMLLFSATNITAKFSSVEWKFKRLTFPQISGSGTADASVERASIKLGFKIVRLPKGISSIIAGDLGCYNEAAVHVFPKYPKLAKVVGALQAQQNGALKDDKFRVRASITESDIWGETSDWEPVLLISSKDISIESLGLKIESQGYAWLYNMLASVFSNVLKTSICNALIGLIGSSSSELLSVVNGAFSSKWDIVKRLLSIDLAAVPICSAAEFMSLIGSESRDDALSAKTLPAREWTLKFDNEGPLGLKLDMVVETRTDVVSRTLVNGVVENSQASRVCAAQGWPCDYLDQATILTVNGARLGNTSKEHIYALLSGRRPLFVHFRLSDKAYQMLRKYMELKALAEWEVSRKFISVSFKAGPLGLLLSEENDFITISAFVREENLAVLGQAEATRKLKPGNIAVGINGKTLVGKSISDALAIIARTSRPARFIFARDLSAAREVNAIKLKELFA